MKKSILIALLSVIAFATKATTHYASPTGTAAYIVSSSTTPMNLQFGINSTGTGDTLLLQGTFTLTEAANIYLQNKDSIYIGSYGTGGIIEGSSDITTNGVSLMVLVDCQNITIENLTFTNNYGSNARGIFVYGSGDNYLIQNNTFTNIGWNTDATAIPTSSDGANAIIVLGNKNPTSANIVNTNGSITNISVLNNSVSDCITGYNESITFIGNVDGFLADSNTITDVTNIGIDAAGHFPYVIDFEQTQTMNEIYPELNQARNGVISNNQVTNAVSLVATSGGIYCDGCADVVYEYNVITACGAGMSIGCEVGGDYSASNVTVANNIFRDNNESGLFIGSSLSEASSAGASSVDTCIVRNNVFYKNGAADTSNDYEIFIQNGTGNQISNNIFYIGDNARGIVAATASEYISNITINHNLFYRESGSQAELVISSTTATLSNDNYQWGDPGFTTTATDDVFEISTTSLAVNNGDPTTTLLSGETDLDGGVRLQGGTIDIGAQESSVVSTAFIPDPTKTYYIDNPAQDVRLAATGESESAYTTNTVTTSDDVEWQFVANANGYWHLDRAGGGTKPRLISDGTNNADMDPTSSTDGDTYYEIEESATSEQYYLTLPDGPTAYQRLLINNAGRVRTVSQTSTSTWARFTITPTSTNNVTTTISNESFESGLGIWNDGGSDARRHIVDSAYANSGDYCIMLRDNTSTSTMTTDDLDLSSYTSINISFSYYTRLFNNSAEEFLLEISTDGGSTYEEVNEWNLNDEFVNDTRYNDLIELTGTFTSTTRIRFRANASANNDLVYIDDITIEGVAPGSSSARTLASSPADESIEDKLVDEKLNFSIHPNPASNMITITGLEEGQIARVYNMLGSFVMETSDKEVNISSLKPGVYIVKTPLSTGRFIKQ